MPKKRSVFLMAFVLNKVMGWSAHGKNGVVVEWGSYPLGPTPKKNSGQGRRTDVIDYRFNGLFIELAGILMRYSPQNIVIKASLNSADEVADFWGASKASLAIAIKQVNPDVEQVEIIGHQQVSKHFTKTKTLVNGLKTIPDGQILEMMKMKSGKVNIDLASAWAMATGYCARREIIHG